MDPVPLRQRAHDVAHARHLRRLRGGLHRAPQAGDAAEHRDRRRLGRDAAGARLGRGDRRGDAPRRCCCSSSSSRGRRRTSGRSRSTAPRTTRKAGVPMLPVTHGKRLHAAAGAALHADSLRGDACCRIVVRMSGVALPRRGARPRRRVPRLRAAHLPRLQRRARAEDLPLLDRLPCAALRRAAGRSLPVAWRSPPCSPPAATAGREVQEHRHHRRRLRQDARADRPRAAACAAWRTSAARRWCCSSASPIARTSARRRWPTSPGREDARPRRRARAGALRHRRSRARHAARRSASTSALSTRASSACAATPRPRSARRKEFKIYYEKRKTGRQLHASTTARRAT